MSYIILINCVENVAVYTIAIDAASRIYQGLDYMLKTFFFRIVIKMLFVILFV